MEHEHKAARTLRRCELASFAIAGAALVWWLVEILPCFSA